MSLYVTFRVHVRLERHILPKLAGDVRNHFRFQNSHEVSFKPYPRQYAPPKIFRGHNNHSSKHELSLVFLFDLVVCSCFVV